MTADENLVARLLDLLKTLRPDQLERIESFARVLSEPAVCTFGSDVVSEAVAHQFNDSLRFHHLGSVEPFRKEKFEYALVAILNRNGRHAQMAPPGNPGHDITVDGERWSLKSQADANVRRESIWISKFMELGRGPWELDRLRQQFLRHLDSYDRVFTLRCYRTLLAGVGMEYEYELVEIPKALLASASGGTLEVMEDSRQDPKPGYCTVRDTDGTTLFRLYFDGGGERKLQVKDLIKARCRVHATWKVIVSD